MVDEPAAAPVTPRVPTLEQVAARAGVSRSTASRAINGGQRVSPAAMQSVATAVHDLGYTPNRAARSLVTRRTDSIALVVPEPDDRVLSDPFFAGVLNGVSAALAESDLQLVLILARPHETDRTARYLRAGHVDGAIVVSHHRDDSIDRVLKVSRLPSVYIGRPLTFHRSTALIDTDNTGGGRLATQHLIAQGRRRIGTIAGPADMSAGIDRLDGWREALDAAGLAADAVVHGNFTIEGGAAGAREILTRYPDLDALFIASDLMAAGALTVLAELGRDVPRDIAVVGYDNSGIASTTSPNLTTVAQPIVAMARAAGEELIHQLHGHPPRPTPLIFPPELITRGST